jgi:heme/copper-type cytochrome/quinol oxidase subunit 4
MPTHVLDASTATHSSLREGVIAGFLGAMGVALWFFVPDLVTGRIFYTPIALGQAVAGFLGLGTPGRVAAFVGYTILHFAAFSVLGIIAAAIVHRSRTHPTIFAAVLLVFAVVETGFYLFMFAMHAGELFGRYGWWQIAGANLLGFALIAWQLGRSHPGLGGAFSKGLSGVESD